MHSIGGREVGWEQGAQLFESGYVTLRDPLIRVGTDLAYVVGTNAAQVTVTGETISFELRVTHIFRRETGERKSIHQHVSVVPALQAMLNRLQAASGQTSS